MKILEYKLRKVIEEIQIWTKDWGQVTVRFLPVGGTRQQVRAGSQGRQMRQRWHLESDAWDTGDTIHEGLKKMLRWSLGYQIVQRFFFFFLILLPLPLKMLLPLRIFINKTSCCNLSSQTLSANSPLILCYWSIISYFPILVMALG